MNYAIIRTAKIKSLPGMARALAHNTRKHTPPNADPEKAGENEISADVGASMARLRDLTQGVRMRKDSVLGIEYLVTASPEAMGKKTKEQQDQYFSDALDWIQKRHGSTNVISSAVHRDELTPHLHVIVVPIARTRDRWGKESLSLSARTWLGGGKTLSKMQTEFANVVGEPHGLDRGKLKSRAKHVSIRDWYTSLSPSNEPLIDFEIPKRGKPEEVVGALWEALKVPVDALKKKAADRDRLDQESARLSKEVSKGNEHIEKLERALLRMSPEELEKLRREHGFGMDGKPLSKQQKQGEKTGWDR